MKSVSLILFDVSTYIVPGSILLTAIFVVFSPDICDIVCIKDVMNSMKITTVTVFIAIAYLLGFLCYHLFRLYPNRKLDKFLKERNKDPFFDENADEMIQVNERFSINRKNVHYQELLIYIRHLSPENYAIIRRWGDLKAMSVNLIYISFLTGLLFIIKSITMISTCGFNLYFLLIGVFWFAACRGFVLANEYYVINRYSYILKCMEHIDNIMEIEKKGK